MAPRRVEVTRPEESRLCHDCGANERHRAVDANDTMAEAVQLTRESSFATADVDSQAIGGWEEFKKSAGG
jgi:hypothetical protein